MSIIERERVVVDSDATPAPPMRHLVTRHPSGWEEVLCGARLPQEAAPKWLPVSMNDCVVCQEIAQNRGILT